MNRKRMRTAQWEGASPATDRFNAQPKQLAIALQHDTKSCHCVSAGGAQSRKEEGGGQTEEKGSSRGSQKGLGRGVVFWFGASDTNVQGARIRA